MTVLFLVRHGEHELQGRALVGRMAGVRLSQAGVRQAETLAARLASAAIDAVYSSPLERARDTAAPIAARLGLEVRIAEELTEIEFGDWTNQPFDRLAGLRRWQRFNSFRSGTTPPNGEAMVAAQSRILGMANRLRDRRPEGRVVLVSHGDVIRAALTYWLGIPLDLFLRIEVDPGSLSAVALSEDGACVLRLNEQPDLP